MIIDFSILHITSYSHEDVIITSAFLQTEKVVIICEKYCVLSSLELRRKLFPQNERLFTIDCIDSFVSIIDTLLNVVEDLSNLNCFIYTLACYCNIGFSM